MMRSERGHSRFNERDELIIPTKNGFSVIPIENLRSHDRHPNGKKDLETQNPVETSQNWNLYKVGNFFQFTLLLGGMMALLAFIGWQIGGFTGLALSLVFSATSLFIGSRFKIDRLPRLRNIRQISYSEGYSIYRMVEKLAKKAEVNTIPFLFLDHREEINAYTLADKDKSAIVLSNGLIRHLNQRELYGVLAHEMAHLKNGDIRLMLFADQISRLTGYMAFAGQILLFLTIPFVLLNQIAFPWLLVLTLFIAPLLSQILQIAISRNREFKADLEAVALSGDTMGLASALRKIGRQTNFWKKLYAPYMRDIPTILRTHPNTALRIERLERIEVD